MRDEDIERLIVRVLQRLQPPVLTLVTAARGYRHLIRTRLASSGLPLALLLAEELTDGEQWHHVGRVLPARAWEDPLSANAYRALVLPFLDYPLAAEIASGALKSAAASKLHEALLAGLPVLALRYHCDPYSELNQLRGAAPGSAYAGHIQSTLAQLTDCGVTLCTINELLEKLTSATRGIGEARATRRYATVKDVATNPALATLPDARLTDAAIEFLKNQKK